MNIPAGSVEYVHVDITATRDGVAVPTAARIAFMPTRATPTEDDWREATLTDGRTARRRYNGDLPPGRYDVWVELTAGDEVPLINAGRLDLT